MISSMLEPASRFSKTVATGIRVSRNTHAPLRLSATLSTAEHWDQSRVAMFLPSLYRSLLLRFGARVTRRRQAATFPVVLADEGGLSGPICACAPSARIATLTPNLTNW